MKAIKKMKTRLIHWLGGKTEMETRARSIAVGWMACAGLKDTADSLYGKSPDEWCGEMYREIERAMDKYMSLMETVERMSRRQGKGK